VVFHAALAVHEVDLFPTVRAVREVDLFPTEDGKLFLC